MRESDIARKVRMCYRKKMYFTLARAEAIAFRRKRAGAVDLRIYFCPICQNYHITSKQRKDQNNGSGQ